MLKVRGDFILSWEAKGQDDVIIEGEVQEAVVDM